MLDVNEFICLVIFCFFVLVYDWSVLERLFFFLFSEAQKSSFHFAGMLRIAYSKVSNGKKRIMIINKSPKCMWNRDLKTVQKNKYK